MVLWVTAQGPRDMEYLWHKNGVPLNDTDRISGSQTRRLLIGDATINDEGSYACFVFSSMKVHPSSMLSRAASLAILEPPVFLGSIENISLNLGEAKDAKFDCNVSGTPPLNLLGGLMEWI